MSHAPKKFNTIKELVFGFVHRAGGRVDYEALTAEVKRHFPKSRWQKSHWVWYRCQMTKGIYRHLFTAEETRNLEGTKCIRGDTKIKNLADPILSRVRSMIRRAAGNNEVLHFKINRWVFARLLQDEIRIKRPIKKSLWDSGIRACQGCGKPFHSLKGVEIHRRRGDQGYSKDNCMLVCRDCHEKNPALA
jgi:hypothetical protein